MQQITQNPTVRVGVIHPNRNNPRTYFDPVDMAELEASIRASGLMQPIMIRPIFDLPDYDYEIIAGERRYRAFKAVYGQDAEIPVVIRNADDDEAEVLAVTENVQRADMSPTEEAEAAERLLKKHHERDEVARRLGWTRSKLDRRLALLNCVPEVRKALTERMIQLGHAELLASAPAEKQAAALKAVIEQKIPVSRLREHLGMISQALAAACFDKSECTNCKFNSSIQSSLFAESIDDGFCTHAACFQDKTVKHLEVVVGRLEETYPMVRIVSQGDDITTIKLIPDGKNGVGETQAKACRSCEKFGCSVSALPDSVGMVEHDVCFDAACHVTKVAVWLNQQKAQASESKNCVAKVVSLTGNTVAANAGKPRKAAATVQVNKAVLEYRLKEWRKITANVMVSKPDLTKRAIIALVLASQGRNLNGSKLGKAYESIVGSGVTGISLPGSLETVTDDAAIIDQLLVCAGATAAFEVSEHDLLALMKHFKVDVADHWCLDKAYLELLTKTQIEEVADELGIRAVIGKDWGKIVSGKKSDLIEKVLGLEGFEYQGKVPANMNYREKTHEVPVADSVVEKQVA